LSTTNVALELPFTGLAPQLRPSIWFAARTRSNFEKKVAAQLQEKCIQTFLPLQSTRRKWSDRHCWVDQPLFSGYVFVRIDPTLAMRVAVLRTMGVTEFVGSRGMGTPIPESEIHAIKTLLSQRIEFQLCPHLRIGHRVRIRGGCLDGVEGILAAVNGDKSLVISVQSIEKSLAIRIQGYEIE
jgi:transcription termination/antitermination protein NusG